MVPDGCFWDSTKFHVGFFETWILIMNRFYVDVASPFFSKIGEFSIFHVTGITRWLRK